MNKKKRKDKTLCTDRMVERYFKSTTDAERDKAAARIVDSLYGQIRYLSRAICGKEDEDLIACGVGAVYKALSRFDPSKKASFFTYVSHVIRSSMMHYMRDNYNMIRLSAYALSKRARGGEDNVSCLFFRVELFSGFEADEDRVDELGVDYNQEIPLSVLLDQACGDCEESKQLVSLRLSGYTTYEAAEKMGMTRNRADYLMWKCRDRAARMFPEWGIYVPPWRGRGARKDVKEWIVIDGEDESRDGERQAGGGEEEAGEACGDVQASA